MTYFMHSASTVILKSDHIYPGSEEGRVTVVLYTEIGTEAFKQWHTVLRPFAESGDIVYILRHFLQVRTHVLLNCSCLAMIQLAH